MFDGPTAQGLWWRLTPQFLEKEARLRRRLYRWVVFTSRRRQGKGPSHHSYCPTACGGEGGTQYQKGEPQVSEGSQV